ncbi:MAG: SDR family oxidoreductase [Gammaproteobacteria bacterium]|nr:SDR family oxidoreductase [Gammaproteobacteria bacterium]
MLDLTVYKDRSVMITGGSNGIGAHIAQRLLSAGAQVIIVDLSAPENELPDNAWFYHCDLSSEQAISALFELPACRSGIDYLINTARGPRGVEPLAESSDSFEAGLGVSLKAPLLLSQHFIHQAGDSLTGQHRAIINISSVCAQWVAKESASYHIAKAGIESLTRYLAVFAGAKGIRVNAVAPGFIVADVYQQRFMADDNESYRQKAFQAHPVNRVGTEQDVADAVLFLASPAAKFITGQTLTVDGGLNLKDGWHQVESFEVKPV